MKTDPAERRNPKRAIGRQGNHNRIPKRRRRHVRAFALGSEGRGQVGLAESHAVNLAVPRSKPLLRNPVRARLVSGPSGHSTSPCDRRSARPLQRGRWRRAPWDEAVDGSVRRRNGNRPQRVPPDTRQRACSRVHAHQAKPPSRPGRANRPGRLRRDQRPDSANELGRKRFGRYSSPAVWARTAPRKEKNQHLKAKYAATGKVPHAGQQGWMIPLAEYKHVSRGKKTGVAGIKSLPPGINQRRAGKPDRRRPNLNALEPHRR